jgi:hypothetical protein
MALIKGSSPDIVSANVKELKKNGISTAQATSIALKCANKGKAAERVSKKVSAVGRNR